MVSIFSSTAVYFSTDLFTFLRWLHVFYDGFVDTILHWSDTKWFIIAAINLFCTSFMSGLVASYDLLPDFMNRNMSYDPMLGKVHIVGEFGVEMYHNPPEWI